MHSPQPHNHHKPAAWPLLGLALLFALAVALWVEHRVWVDPAALNDDVRNQIYWMAQIAQPKTFAHDYIAQYFTQPLFISPVLWALYACGGHWFSPEQISQMLPFGMVLVTTFLLFQFAKSYQNPTYAFWICFAFNCSLWIFKNMAGGLSRSFIYPLLFGILWQLHHKNWVLLCLALLLSALIYPPAFFLGLILVLIEAILQVRQDHLLKPRLVCLFSSLLGSLGILFWRSAHTEGSHSGLFGALNSNQSIEGLRDFQLEGRVVLFPWGNFSESWPLPFQFLGDVLERFPHLYILIPTVSFVFLLWAYNRFAKAKWGPLLIPPTIWRLLVSSCILYVLAWVFLFYFYVPERYLQYTLPLIPTFMVGALIYQLQQHYAPQKRWPYMALASLGLILTSLFWRADLMNPKPNERRLYAFLNTSAPQALIAASPGLASNIPLYAHRSVFISNEAYIPFHQGYFQEMKNRLKTFLEAYYAVDANTLSRFVLKNGIHYFVVQNIDFKEPRLTELPKRYYHAFDSKFFNSLKQVNSRHYLLTQAPTQCVPFQTQGLKVVEMPCLLKVLNPLKVKQPIITKR